MSSSGAAGTPVPRKRVAHAIQNLHTTDHQSVTLRNRHAARMVSYLNTVHKGQARQAGGSQDAPWSRTKHWADKTLASTNVSLFRALVTGSQCPTMISPALDSQLAQGSAGTDARQSRSDATLLAVPVFPRLPVIATAQSPPPCACCTLEASGPRHPHILRVHRNQSLLLLLLPAIKS